MKTLAIVFAAAVVAAPGVARAAETTITAEGLSIHDGLYFDLEPGGFFTFGGGNGVSNMSPYIGIDAGYDITRAFALELNIALGTSTGNPRKSAEDGEVPLNDPQALPDYMTLIFDLGGIYTFDISERLKVPAGVLVGGSRVSPKIQIDPPPVTVNFGVTSGIEYLTWAEGMSVGMEFSFYYVLTYNIPALAVHPSFKYVF